MYVPLNIGYVAQYCLQRFGDDVEVKLFKDPEKLLAHCLADQPDVVGLSFYYWNTDINHAVTRRLRAQYGSDLLIIQGGASVGTDSAELAGLFERFPPVDAYVINEGELGFANLIRDRLSGDLWKKPVDGAVFRSAGALVQGLPVGLTLDLATLQSPWLNGLLDDFLVGDYMPMLQASRLCPYTCAFCTSGKNKGKLRAFPIEQVKAEIDMVCDRFSDRPYMMLLLSDENFGILARDVELAEYIRERSNQTNYPQSIFFYNDKRFTETSRKVIESLGQINTHGLILSLQSENPETLKEVKRRNLPPEQIEAALKWASDLNMPTSTELIFGMPYETRQSFFDLMRSCVERGFDSILGFNLFLMDGIELNTPASRAKHGVRTMFRPVGTYYGLLDGEFCAESEEIVVASKTFSFEDFLYIRSLNFMFYSVFALNFYKSFFHYIRHAGVDFTQFMIEFIWPSADRSGLPSGYVRFVDDFRDAITGELFSTRAAVKEHLRELLTSNGSQVGEPIRQNVFYGSRLIYREQEWLAQVLLLTLAKFVDPGQRDIFNRAEFLLEFCARERIDLRGNKVPEPLMSEFDIAAWKADKYRRPLEDYRMTPQPLRFVTRADVLRRMESFRHAFADYAEDGFFYAALDFMGRRDLLYQLDYDSARDTALASHLLPGGGRSIPAVTVLGAQTV
jgi:radical SAM superfamily enzyme YgiQ (UPF0313 family)